MTTKPEKFDDVVEVFLDDLRESGKINMFGAAVYLQEVFNMDRYEAKDCLMYWMKNFGQRTAVTS